MAKRPAACSKCGRSTAESGYTSRSGKCLDCAVGAQIENATQIRDRAGPYYERWLAGTIKAARLALTHTAERVDEAA